VRCDRTVAPKGGRLRSWNVSHDLRTLFMRFDLLCSSMLGTSTSAQSNLSRLVLPILLYLLLPLVFLRLDWFSWCFHRLDAKPPFQVPSVLSFIRLDLLLHIVPRIRYLGFTLKGKRVPWLRRRTCPLASPNEVLYAYTPLTNSFSGAVAGDQVIKIQSSIVFVNIFSFSLDFTFTYLNFDCPQNKKINIGFR
jgi:hypothetical protein